MSRCEDAVIQEANMFLMRNHVNGFSQLTIKACKSLLKKKKHGKEDIFTTIYFFKMTVVGENGIKI